MSKTIKLHGVFESVDNGIDNSTFKQVKIKVHGLGKNSNKSDITNEAHTLALKSIFGIPIVAKYTEDEDIYGNDGDLTAHNRVLKKDAKGSYKLTYDTVPLGFVSPGTNVYQEDLVEPDGTERTYIVVDNVVLWKRYESTQKIIEWLENGVVPKVSMEIGNVDGIIADDGSFQIDSFEYESICCLGSNVTPCFPRAEIDDLSFSKKEFEELYKEMISEYSNSNKESDIENYKTIEGGNTVSEVFQLTAEQFSEEIRRQLSAIKVKDQWDWEYTQYSYVDYKENQIFAFDRADGYKLVGFDFSTEGDAISINFESKKRMKFEIVPFEEGQVDMAFEVFPQDAIDYAVQFKEKELTKSFETDLETKVKEYEVTIEEKDGKIETLTSDFEKLQEEKEGLAQFKQEKLAEERKEQESAIFEQYSDLDGIELFEEIKNDTSKFEKVEDLEKEIALIYCKHKANFSKQENTKTTIKIPLEKKEEIKTSPYGDLFDKYLKK